MSDTIFQIKSQLNMSDKNVGQFGTNESQRRFSVSICDVINYLELDHEY